jgi:sporulation protein YlmC with PRC-barrel domain
MKSALSLKHTAVAVASIFGVALSAPAISADTAKSDRTVQQQQDRVVAHRNIRVSELIGKDVRNQQGEDLGDIKDVIIDMNNGRVHYVVLSFGGFMGLGDKLFAYPMRVFRPTADKDDLILAVDKERLRKAPGFEDKNWPDWDRADYRTQVDRYHATDTVKIKPSTNMRLIRGSTLVGKDVNGADGKDIGEIEDVVVNMANGDVRYAVVEFDKAWSMDDKYFTFPLRSFKMGATVNDDLVLNVTRDALARTPGFDKKKWPNLNDPTWNSEIDRYGAASRR